MFRFGKVLRCSKEISPGTSAISVKQMYKTLLGGIIFDARRRPCLSFSGAGQRYVMNHRKPTL